VSADSSSTKGHDILQRVAAKALDDDDYKQRLMSDPKSVLRDEGMKIDDNTNIVVHENSMEHVHLVLPPKRPGGRELHVDEVRVEHLTAGLQF
jgi:hypothetical protein